MNTRRRFFALALCLLAVIVVATSAFSCKPAEKPLLPQQVSPRPVPPQSAPSQPTPARFHTSLARDKEYEAGSIAFTVTDRWGCSRVVFTTDWDQVLKRILVEEKPGVTFVLYPNKVRVKSDDPVELSREQLDWMIWETRYVQMRNEVVVRPVE